jgi:hypothetical protein
MMAGLTGVAVYINWVWQVRPPKVLGWAPASVGASSCFGLWVIIFEDSDVQACSPD